MTKAWSHKAGQIAAQRMVVDVGTTSLTGVRIAALDGVSVRSAAHPIYQTAPLSASDCARLGSDFQRVGFLYDTIEPSQEEVVDAYGVAWLFTDGFPAPFRHPLESADWKTITRFPKPKLPNRFNCRTRVARTCSSS